MNHILTIKIEKYPLFILIDMGNKSQQLFSNTLFKMYNVSPHLYN